MRLQEWRGSQWVLIAAIAQGAAGEFALRLPVPAPGEHAYRVLTTKPDGRYGVASPAVALHVVTGPAAGVRASYLAEITPLITERPVDMLAHMILGALSEAAMAIARSPHPKRC